jgi:hypothetical protein
MIHKPGYFEDIRARAAKRWVQLEQDPELAGPWHQLFKQVQSPRHVVSELLQNADDAGATDATVEIRDGEFIFSHNGEDFTEEHFASLCRFGYSNKRALHTIGFRGIGFKSTFSLGDEVRLVTPTLAVSFARERFTEPVWCGGASGHPSMTSVRVTIKDQHRQQELEKNLNEWLRSPASLLFFHHIRSLRIGDQEVRWESQGHGPIGDSEWMSLSSSPEERHLLIRSPAEEFPAEALKEIRQERMVSRDEESTFPPCRIEIVLGMEGRLFVILPTGVSTDLPFACNAPFVQDPARVKIKDPDISPTNRWLLARAGELAAKAMLVWVCDETLQIDQRAQAYQLLSDVERENSSLEGSCATLVEKGIESGLQGHDFLLTENGLMSGWGAAAAVPSVLMDVWSAELVSALFDDRKRPILSRSISAIDRTKLIRWGCAIEHERESIIHTINSKHMPRPESWSQLLQLWSFVAPEVTGYQHGSKFHGVRICPVEGQNILFSASDVVRLAEGKTLGSDDDWAFLASHLIALQHSWPRYLADKRRVAEQKGDIALGKQVDAALRVLDELGLAQSTEGGVVLKRVAESFYAQEKCGLDSCVRLAQLAAKLDVRVPDGFHLVTRDGYRRPHQVVADPYDDIDSFVTSEWAASHVLHEAYSRSFVSCSRDEWQQWLSSGRSGLPTFVPLVEHGQKLWDKQASELLTSRGFDGYQRHPYSSNEYILSEYGFDEEHWEHWRAMAEREDGFWWRLLQRLASLPGGVLKNKSTGTLMQIASRGRGAGNRSESASGFRAGWIDKLREVKCIQDTRGHYRQPAEVLRLTRDTAALVDVEPFVRSEFDTETNRWLLDLLGVRDTPTGPQRVLDRLRALATVDSPPVDEVVKWTMSLDHLMARCGTSDADTIRAAFASERLIFTRSNTWAGTLEVFLSPDRDEVPDAALIHASVAHLTLWHKVGVADRPTVELALRWLSGLASGQKLSGDELRRVRSLLPRHAERIWNECGHWLNLEGEWTPTDSLLYSLTMQGLVAWKHLFTPVKQKTADLQKLSANVCEREPFADLRGLAQTIEDRFEHRLFGLPDPQKAPWLNVLGAGLRRIVLDDQDETGRVRELANRLARTGWQVASGLQTIPYIDGTPAGTPRRIDVLWKDHLLYVNGRSAAQIAKAVAQELGRVFNKHEIADAIKLCYDRSPEFVMEYLEENFTLAMDEQMSPVHDKGEPTDTSDGREETANGEEDRPDATTTAGRAPQSSIVDSSADTDAHDQVDLGDEPFEHKDEHLAHERDDAVHVNEHERSRPYRPRLRPPGPSLMERFAKANGYAKDGSDRFYNPDGSWIERVSGGHSFPWERRSAAGELLQCYWDKEHCIQRDALQLDADIWKLCDQFPDKYSLLLVDGDDNPLAITGRRLREMCDEGEFTLYPAKYRLVYGNGDVRGRNA